MNLNFQLQRAFDRREVLKVISGLNNFDRASVLSVVRSAEAGGATFVDIAASPALIKEVKNSTNIPVCASAVEPKLLVLAVNAGADLVEIGNFDSFYATGRIFGADEVLNIARETRALLPDIALSVTVPHILPLDEQAKLAEALVKAGADIIQTEGGTSSRPKSPGILGTIEKAAPTLAAAHVISRAVSVPVLCASGISSITAPMAIAAGASGIGVGSAINQLNDEVAMVAAVRGLVESLQLTVNSLK